MRALYRRYGQMSLPPADVTHFISKSRTPLFIVASRLFSTATAERKRWKRKRRLVVDQTTELSNQDIKEQLADPSDLLCHPDMAPPTAHLMQWKESGGARQLFGRFSSTGICSKLQQVN